MSNDANSSVYVDVEALDWQPTGFDGVMQKVLWRDEASEAYTAIFRLEPGASLPRHRHQGVEQTYVLKGSLVDEQGVCTEGNFVWRSRGSIHTAYAPDGCVALGIFQRPNELLGDRES